MAADDGAGPPTDDLVSQFAARRSAVVEQESRRGSPDYLESIERASVRYSLRPVALPLAQVDVLTFLESMRVGYETTLSPVAPGELIRQLPPDKLYRMSQADLLSMVFKRDPYKMVTFEGGRFPLKFDFVPIRTIEVDSSSVHVEVEGSSTVAENVAQEVLQLVWAAAGSRRSWEELSPFQVAVVYGTRTRVRLQVPLDRLLGTELRALVDEHVLGNERFAAAMRPLEKAQGFRAAPDIASVVSLSSVTFRVDTIDLGNGVTHSGGLTFSVPTRADLVSRTIVVSSPLGFDDHLRLVSLFVEMLSE